MARDKTDTTDKTSAALNEWGIPDWRNEEEYGDSVSWTRDRWRWEFFRRREDLRKCFDDHAEAHYRSNQQLLNDPTICVNCFSGRPSEPGFVVSIENSVELFGYVSIPNPRIGSQPAKILSPFKDYSAGNVFNGNERDFTESIRRHVEGLLASKGVSFKENASREDPLEEEQGTFLNSSAVNNFSMALKRDEMAVKFDLGQPLEPQLTKAREMLRSQQKELHGKLIQTRQHPTKWLQYLRSLDAREAGATWSEIAALHVETAQTEQTGRDKWQQARALCFNF